MVRIEGEHKTYSRAAPEGRKLHNYFCPTCGATVGWRADLRPGLIGVAVGSFNDKTFPKPAASIWEDSKCEWARAAARRRAVPARTDRLKSHRHIVD